MIFTVDALGDSEVEHEDVLYFDDDLGQCGFVRNIEGVFVEEGEEAELVEVNSVEDFVHFDVCWDCLGQELDPVLHPVLWVVLFPFVNHLIYSF